MSKFKISQNLNLYFFNTCMLQLGKNERRDILKEQRESNDSRDLTIETIGFYINGDPNMAAKAQPYIDYFKQKCALEYCTPFHQSQSEDGTLIIIDIEVPTEQIADFKEDLSKIAVNFVYKGTLYGPNSPINNISEKGKSR